jgi:predicted NAD/FAD-binding protein
MKIAIVGAGISGLVSAYLLWADHEITIYEAQQHIGGHTNTVPIFFNGRKYEIDTGFIVYNKKNYPNFSKLLDRLGVPTQKTSMSFSVRCEQSGREFNGTSVNQLFAQRSNLFRPDFYKMIVDILKFNRDAKIFLQNGDFEVTFGEFLEKGGYSAQLREDYAIPMTAAIWSGSRSQVLETPFLFIARFYENHGMLELDDRPQWRVIQGGSHNYVGPLVSLFRDRIRLLCPVKSIARNKTGLAIKDANGDSFHYDNVIMATHSNQALQLLESPTPDERDILSPLAYQDNEVVLHWDTSLLPKRQLAWASWNYFKTRDSSCRATVTYNMNILQGIQSDTVFCVSLNMTDRIDPAKIIRRFNYSHPVFSLRAIEAQKHLAQINGVNKTYFCGAYWGSGFHEDGVNSALNVCRYFGKEL